MINQGWIKLHRKLIDHWLFNEKTKKTKLEAWLIILLESNHSDAKVLINGSLIECKRGQSVKSVGTWAKQFRWSNAKVNTFFKILEKDGMIEREGLSKTTRLTICNYESYQGKEITEKKQNTNRKETNLYKQECKEEIKNDKEVNSFSDLCLKDSFWVETICRMNKIKDVALWLKKFEQHLISVGETKPNIKDYKSHFNNWLRKQDLRPPKIKREL